MLNNSERYRFAFLLSLFAGDYVPEKSLRLNWKAENWPLNCSHACVGTHVGQKKRLAAHIFTKSAPIWKMFARLRYHHCHHHHHYYHFERISLESRAVKETSRTLNNKKWQRKYHRWIVTFQKNSSNPQTLGRNVVHHWYLGSRWSTNVDWTTHWSRRRFRWNDQTRSTCRYVVVRVIRQIYRQRIHVRHCTTNDIVTK